MLKTHILETLKSLVGKQVIIWFVDGQIFAGELRESNGTGDEYYGGFQLVLPDGLHIHLTKDSVLKIHEGEVL